MHFSHEECFFHDKLYFSHGNMSSFHDKMYFFSHGNFFSFIKVFLEYGALIYIQILYFYHDFFPANNQLHFQNTNHMSPCAY